MSIQQNFPAISPSLNLNFARSKTLDPRITFSRTSTATRVNEQGLIEVVSADIPRFDHKYENGVIKSLGLLVEESRQNLLSFSDSFMSGTGWGTASGTREENVGVSPDGTTTADKIISTGGGVFRAGIPVSNATAYTYSIFIKNFAGTGRITALGFERFGSTVVNAIIDIDLISGTILSSTANVSSSSILSYPNGWYRVSVTTTSVDTTATVVNYTSISGNEYLLWGVQFEQGSFPTSYIPTTASTVTRNPDNVSMTGDNFSDWYNPTEWTLMIAARRNYSGNFLTYPNLARINDGTINNNVGFYGAQGSTQFTNFGVNSGGVNQTPYVAINVPTTSQFKMIQALKENDSTFGGNGTLTTTDTSVLMPVGVNQLLIGSDGGGNRWGATIQQLTYYPVRLPNSTLQTLTK